jgi:hypothetical protein
MRRSHKITFLLLGLVLGVLLAAASATSSPSGNDRDDQGQQENGSHHNRFVRWDLVLIVNGVAVAGGTDVATDAATKDTIALTGSGQVEPREEEAAGGGTFVHKHADGSLVAKGAYVVTGFVSWQRLRGGNFSKTGLVDGIGNGPGSSEDEGEPSSGILTVNVRFVPDGTAPSAGIDGVLSVHCDLPDTVGGDFEGVTVTVASLNLDFTPAANVDPNAHGVTLFHRLR